MDWCGRRFVQIYNPPSNLIYLHNSSATIKLFDGYLQCPAEFCGAVIIKGTTAFPNVLITSAMIIGFSSLQMTPHFTRHGSHDSAAGFSQPLLPRLGTLARQSCSYCPIRWRDTRYAANAKPFRAHFSRVKWSGEWLESLRPERLEQLVMSGSNCASCGAFAQISVTC